MKCHKLTKQDYLINSWSGGTTTEILISPDTATLGKRDFDFRISSAKVELETSEFSPFKGYQRIIMSLNNPLTLFHSGKEFPLKPFQAHSFSGDFLTTSKGKCQDFNLIYKEDFHGSMFAVKNLFSTFLPIGCGVVYALEDLAVKASHRFSEEVIPLKKGEALTIETHTQYVNLQLSAQDDSHHGVIAVLTKIIKK